MNSKEFKIKMKRLCEYNCIRRPDEMVFHSGDVVYLSTLRNKNWKARKHTVEAGETVRDIGLRYAVKPEKILKKNDLQKGTKLRAGQKLWLR